jgi:hypothetical protein
MEQHHGAQDLARFPLDDPSWDSPAINLEPINVLSHVGEEGHIEDVEIVYLNIPPYINTFISGTSKFWGDSDALRLSIQSNPRTLDPCDLTL